MARVDRASNRDPIGPDERMRGGAGDSYREERESPAERTARRREQEELALEKKRAPAELSRLEGEAAKLAVRRKDILDKLGLVTKDSKTAAPPPAEGRYAHSSVQQIEQMLAGKKTSLEDDVHNRGILDKIGGIFGRIPKAEEAAKLEIAELEATLQSAYKRRSAESSARYRADAARTGSIRLMGDLDEVERAIAEVERKIRRNRSILGKT